MPAGPWPIPPPKTTKHDMLSDPFKRIIVMWCFRASPGSFKLATPTGTC